MQRKSSGLPEFTLRGFPIGSELERRYRRLHIVVGGFV